MEMSPSTLMQCSPRIHLFPTGVAGTALALADDHTCALISEGGVMCWGRNDYGQLGIGSTANIDRPERVGLLSGVCMHAHWQMHGASVSSSVFCKKKQNETSLWFISSVGSMGSDSLQSLYVVVLIVLTAWSSSAKVQLAVHICCADAAVRTPEMKWE